jgi:hypothetical protein
MYLIRTQSSHCRLITCPRFKRFISTSLFRASRSLSESINDFIIPTRKHFANRQQLHERRYSYDTKQSPSFSHTNSCTFKVEKIILYFYFKNGSKIVDLNQV